MNYRYLILSFISLLFIDIQNIAAQKGCNWSTLNDASEYYRIGNFDSVLVTIEGCVYGRGFENEVLQISGMHLLAKTYLELDQDSSASKITSELIQISPDFQPNYLNDPPRFILMIQSVKAKGNELVVTSVSKKAENIYEAPAMVIAVNESQFRQRGYNDYEALLHDLPGFDISRSNGNLYTHAYQRGYRSINTNRTLFLVDGVEENDLWSSNVYLSRQYPISSLKKVEVIYGPASTMYGSNAFLDVVNLITKSPEDFIKPGKLFGVNVITGYGSYNTKFIDGSLAVRTKSNNIAFSITGRTFLSDEQDLSHLPEYDYEPNEMTDAAHAKYLKNLTIKDSTAVAAFLAKYPNPSDFFTYDETSKVITPTEFALSEALRLDNVVYDKVAFADKTEAYYLDAKLKIYDLMLGWSGWKMSEGPGAQYNDAMFLSYIEGQKWEPVHSYFYAKYDKKLTNKLDISNPNYSQVCINN